MSTRNLTVVGLDAATFDVIDPLIEAGELPNLARLFESGSRGVLRSVTHPLTPHAWALRAFDGVLTSSSVDGVLIFDCCAVLLGFAVAFFAIGWWRFRPAL